MFNEKEMLEEMIEIVELDDPFDTDYTELDSAAEAYHRAQLLHGAGEGRAELDDLWVEYLGTGND